MTWDNFNIYAVVAIFLWIAGAIFAWTGRDFPKSGGEEKRIGRSSIAILLSTLGIVVFAAFIIGFWTTLERPPLRTMGETRLWYSFFMAIAGLLTYCFWNYKWILSFSTLMSAVFAIINIAKPEIHSQTLMPALQSAWFIPHVTIYIFSYALLGCSFLLAVAGILSKPHKQMELIASIDKLAMIGIVFFTIGMLFGALWAKQAWGDFWTWDAKESWALVTFLFYMLYFHLRRRKYIGNRFLFAVILISFVSLQMCWWGVNYLPSATESIHTYTQTN